MLTTIASSLFWLLCIVTLLIVLALGLQILVLVLKELSNERNER